MCGDWLGFEAELPMLCRWAEQEWGGVYKEEMRAKRERRREDKVMVMREQEALARARARARGSG